MLRSLRRGLMVLRGSCRLDKIAWVWDGIRKWEMGNAWDGEFGDLRGAKQIVLRVLHLDVLLSGVTVFSRERPYCVDSLPTRMTCQHLMSIGYNVS